MIDPKNIMTLAGRTFRHLIESPIAYVVAVFFYGFVGGIFGLQFFINANASIDSIGGIAPWVLWFVIPALTMGLISEELRSGTFEHLSTLPLRDWDIILGKFLGYALLALILIGGLFLYPLVASFLTKAPQHLDWGASLGILAGLYFLCLFYGAMGLFASCLAKNQVVALIIGMTFCTFFFFLGQFMGLLPSFLSGFVEWMGVNSHLETLARGVWDLRDLVYFGSMTGLFLYFASIRLSTRRF